jgi:hypothetical protein
MTGPHRALQALSLERRNYRSTGMWTGDGGRGGGVLNTEQTKFDFRFPPSRRELPLLT